jgi:hypothetical protein
VNLFGSGKRIEVKVFRCLRKRREGVFVVVGCSTESACSVGAIVDADIAGREYGDNFIEM